MTTAVVHDPSRAPLAQGSDVDTIRALCHDLRQPLAAIRLLAASDGGDVRRRLDGILEQASWLAEMVDEVLVGAKSDLAEYVDAGHLAEMCALRAQPTAGGEVRCAHDDTAIVLAKPVALSRAIGCLVDNAVRAAGEGGHVLVLVQQSLGVVTVTVSDDGPGLGHVASRTSLGLTITRALVASCGGRFELVPGESRGAVARITLPAVAPAAAAS